MDHLYLFCAFLYLRLFDFEHVTFIIRRVIQLGGNTSRLSDSF